jgi:hypothetical protein
MNVHDSERIAGLLDEAGYLPVEPGVQADIVVFNTCAVRENADNKLYGNLSFLERNGVGQKYPGVVSMEKDNYYFNEYVTPIKIVYGMLDGNEPFINMELKDNRNQTQYSKCFVPKIKYYQFDGSYGRKNLYIMPHSSERGQTTINIQQHSKLANIMKSVTTIQLSVIPRKLCAPNS